MDTIKPGLKFCINNRLLIVKRQYCTNWDDVDFWECEREEDGRISTLRTSTIEYYLNKNKYETPTR